MGRVGIEPTTLGLKGTILAPVRRSFLGKSTTYDVGALVGAGWRW
jgi:hypothetical protein